MNEFQVDGQPYFSISVLDDSAVPLVELDQMSAQYTLKMTADGQSSAASAANHIAKALRFHVRSNLRWMIVPTDDENVPDWISPFPAYGEKDGIFYFKAERNTDPDNSRETYFNIMVDKGAGVYEPLQGLLRAWQDKSPDFLEASAAKFSATYAEQNIQLRIKSNVNWDYSLIPAADYATQDVDWITDSSEHTPDQQNDTLRFRLAANAQGIRGAVLKLSYSLEGNKHEDLIPITQYPETEVSLDGFPVQWVVRVEGNTFADTFPSDGTGAASVGHGKITFNNECGKAADTKGSIGFDMNDNSPRVAGVWPGDYCEFVASSPVSAGTIVKIAFATRVSATGHKYWRLEYRDGEQWKIAGTSFVDEEVAGPDGKPVVYTHAMNPDGATNTLVETVVTYENATDQVEFRFICAANYKANGSGPLAAPNTGTWRLSVDTKSASDPYQPSISVIAAGSEPPVMANVSLSASYLYLEGKPEGAKVFRVTSDQDFTVRPEQPWIHVDKVQESSGDNVAISVTCDQNNDSKGREGYITILAGITRRQITIIQGAVGGGTGGEIELDPFVSVISGSRQNVPYKSGTQEVKVMTNMTITPEVSDPWLSLSLKSTEQNSTVYTYTYNVNYGMNPSAEQQRTATVRFYNGNRSAEVVFVQDKNISNKTIYFEDDFSWLKPYVDAYKAAYPSDELDPVAMNLSTHAQPNIWSKFEDTIGKAVLDQGYEDLNPDAATLYMQDCYFKLGAGNKQTGLRLPEMAFEGDTPVNVQLTFNWCAHMSNSGNIDNTPVVVCLEGPGLCADTETKTSNVFTTTQTKGNLAWQEASIVLNGVTKDTRIIIKLNFGSFAEDGNHRWHLDNLLIIKNN